MFKAQLITIGTEITCGEVVNSNAAWISTQLEDLGVRVFSHLTVRDQYDELQKALKQTQDAPIVVVTGGLGPTSDDITRKALADYCAQPNQFDDDSWQQLSNLYAQRGLPLREAHKHQCYAPAGSEKLNNPVGTAHGFTMLYEGRRYFVLPGPPSELQGMWRTEVAPRLQRLLPSTDYHWQRWTCLGAPESEVAELVEKVIAGQSIEVGYRAAIPYVKVKLYINQAQRALGLQVTEALRPYLVGEGESDLAEDLLQIWPEPRLEICDQVTDALLVQRLFGAQARLNERQMTVPQLSAHIHTESTAHLSLSKNGEEALLQLRYAGRPSLQQSIRLPYKVSVETERGKRSAAEWALWYCVKELRAHSR